MEPPNKCRIEKRPRVSAPILHFAFSTLHLGLASLTGFAPVISCMRGRHVVWTTPQAEARIESAEWLTMRAALCTLADTEPVCGTSNQEFGRCRKCAQRNSA